MDESLEDGLRRFREEVFPRERDRFRELVEEGQHPATLFIGCCDSRVVPSLLTDASPGDLFVARNVGALVPPHDPDAGGHETAAAIEYAVRVLAVSRVVVCGHSQCGAIRALYEPPPDPAPNLQRWLRFARDAAVDLPPGARPDPDLLRRTERRSVALQVERLSAYPGVREAVDDGRLALQGWHYLLDEGRVDRLDPQSGAFEPVG